MSFNDPNLLKVAFRDATDTDKIVMSERDFDLYMSTTGASSSRAPVARSVPLAGSKDNDVELHAALESLSYGDLAKYLECRLKGVISEKINKTGVKPYHDLSELVSD